ncbi:hypothetical protein BGZ63DRAFT_360575 [Mariannaea sp. PMI_226]|nr:hypothetical protein BGZ63DRAFT_360575 [Mariannaea sp. PMI_226]
MVNIPGRSRGCATCRRRKIKCDESVPACLRCVNMGLQCPGARTEAFFVHSVSGSSSRHVPGIPTRALVPLPRLPGRQPSCANAFDQLFVSHFVESFFGPMKPAPAPGTPIKTWLHELPVFLTSPEPCLVKHAIRATSMVSYGTLVDDVSIKVAAHKWYAKALQDLQRLLASGTTSFAESIVGAAVLLIHFETLAGTSRRAWFQHVKGAAMLLVAGGPERCRDGFMHQIFSHLRFQTFVASMAENEVPAFASYEWMTIPFEIYPKMIFDQLIDILYTVQKCISVANELIKLRGNETTALMKKLDKLIQGTMIQMHQWWSKCLSSGIFRESKKTQAWSLASMLDNSKEPPLLPFDNVQAAALSSLYDAANIIILRLLFFVSPLAASYDLRVRQHAESIFASNHLINAASGPAPDRGSIMMVLQLKIVSLWSSASQQRTTAARMLQGEKYQGGGLSDISTVSQYFADVAAYILQHHPTE